MALAMAATAGLGAQDPAFFTSGPSADLLISGYGFDRTGGPLRFNHPGGVAVVSGRLVLADRNNNRVLVWSGLPRSGEEPPSLVLGQPSFETNAPGNALDELTELAHGGRDRWHASLRRRHLQRSHPGLAVGAHLQRAAGGLCAHARQRGGMAVGHLD
jgi:hypothetical protein